MGGLGARLSAVLLGLAAALPAQLRIGMRASKIFCDEWVRGEAPALGRAPAAGVTLVAFYGRRPELLLGDVAYLESLVVDRVERSVQVLVVVPAADTPGVDQLRRCSVAVDEQSLTERAWLCTPPEHHRNLVAVDAAGAVVFTGAPGGGVLDMLRRCCSGEVDTDYEERARAWRRQLIESYDDLASGPTIALLEPLVGRSPRDGVLAGLLYLTQATKANDRDAAQATLAAAIQAMQRAPRALAVFADLAMRGDPQRAELWSELIPALEAAAVDAATDPSLQLALLRAQVAAGDGRAVGRHAMRCRKLVTSTAAGCLDYAMALAQAETPMIHLDLAEAAVDRAASLGAPPRLLAAARYVVALRCAEDPAAAKGILDAYIALQDELYSLNNDAWALLTEVKTMGRFDWFAVGLVERMLEDRDAMSYFEFDTAALAMFQVARLADAVALQEVALEQGGREEAAYRDRLARYRARLSGGAK